MNIRDYWNLPPLSQDVIRAAVLPPAAPPRSYHPAVTTCLTTPPGRHEQTYKVLYARDLLHGLGDVDGVDDRSDAACSEAAELLGFPPSGLPTPPL